MTLQSSNPLDDALTSLTRWPGGPTALWRRALGPLADTLPRRHPRLRRLLNLDVPTWSLAGIGIAAIFFIAVIANLSTRANTPRLAAESSAPLRAFDMQKSLHALGYTGSSSVPADTAKAQPESGDALSASAKFPQSGRARGPNSTQYSYQLVPGAAASAQPSDTTLTAESSAPTITTPRQVIRRATIDLKTSDVRAIFLKAQQLIRPENGEYIEDSSLTGAGPAAQANLTLRVDAARLSEVLNALRALAEVTSEVQGGEDVTAQVVDLEARLRNERRVETEILELLESRKDAPLSEILSLRTNLGTIREEIERMTGQREQLARLVSLSTILVIIRAGDAPLPPGDTLIDYFSDQISRAWHGGLRFLAETLATMLSILIGGLVWWLLLAAVIYFIRRKRRARSEPRP